jgi:hypothetical protein
LAANNNIRTFFTLLLLTVAITLNAADIYQTTADLNLRSGPGSKYNSIGIVKNGENVSVLEKDNSLWFKVEYKGKNGFLSSKFLTLVVVEPPKVVESPKVEPVPEESNSTMYFIIGAVVVIIIMGVALSGKKKSTNPTNTNSKQKSEKELKEELKKHILNNIKITVTTSNSTNSNKDDSIIDVTGESYNINTSGNLKKYSNGVPKWAHHYVYSYSELQSATNEQKKFYSVFKINFLNGEYFDLEGNTNYAFILLFDLLEEYEIHKDSFKTEKLLNNLGQCYPKIKSYAMPFLIKKMQAKGDTEGVERLSRQENKIQPVYQSQNTNSAYSFDGDYWGLGTKNKVKLNLTDDEVKILNSLIDTNNRFNSIDFCSAQIIKLFFSILKELKDRFKASNSTIEEQTAIIAEIELTKHYKFRKNSGNYNSQASNFVTTIYQTIYKLCENSLRDYFFVGRKTDLKWYIHSDDALNEFNNRFNIHIQELLSKNLSALAETDDKTEIELNGYNKGRWKNKLEKLKTNFNEKEHSAFYKNITELGNQNKKNPSIENIFFEASKFIAKFSNETSLKLYVQYVHYDLISDTFDNKQLTKTIQKSLFKNAEQLKEFETIVGQLIKDKNLGTALQSVSNIYITKRKKIQLDTTKIKEVQEQHSGTVELLNEYLKDELEVESTTVKTEEINLNINYDKEVSSSSIFIKEITLTAIQSDALILLEKNGFSISIQDFDAFAKSNGAFKNSLIESINETCFEFIDDVLIEEEEENFNLNETYYQKLLAK